MPSKLFFTILILLILTACSETEKKSLEKNPVKKIDLHVPDKIIVKKTEHHIQIPGTRVFVPLEGEFSFESEAQAYNLENDCDLYVNEYPFAFESKRDSIIKDLSSDSLYYRKDFLIGTNKATLLYYIHDGLGEDLRLITGNKNSSSTLTAFYNTNDVKSRDKMQKLLLNSFFDENAKRLPYEFKNYTIDFSGSPFIFTGYSSLSYTFTTNGHSDFKKWNNLNRVLIGFYGKNAKREVEEYNGEASMIKIESTLENSQVLNGVMTEEIVARGHEKSGFFKLSPEAEKNPCEVLLYIFTYGNMMFEAMAFDHHEEMLKEFKKLARTIKMKEKAN